MHRVSSWQSRDDGFLPLWNNPPVFKKKKSSVNTCSSEEGLVQTVPEGQRKSSEQVMMEPPGAGQPMDRGQTLHKTRFVPTPILIEGVELILQLKREKLASRRLVCQFSWREGGTYVSTHSGADKHRNVVPRDRRQRWRESKQFPSSKNTHELRRRDLRRLTDALEVSVPLAH